MPTYLVIVNGSVVASKEQFEEAKTEAFNLAHPESGAAITEVIGILQPVKEPFIFTSLKDVDNADPKPKKAAKKSEPTMTVIEQKGVQEVTTPLVDEVEEELAPVELDESELPVAPVEPEPDDIQLAHAVEPVATKPKGNELSGSLDINKWMERYLDLWLHRVPFDAGYCPRCGDENIMRAIIPPLGAEGDGKIRICNISGCHASDVAQRSMFGREDHHPDSGTVFSAAIKEAPKATSATPAPAAPVNVPDAEEVSEQLEVLGVKIDRCPEEWANEPITKKGGESDGGQCKALNTALSEIGWSGNLRHQAVQVILDDVFIDSLSDLTKAQADICLQFLSKAQPQHLAAVKKRMDKWAKEKKVGIDAEVID